MKFIPITWQQLEKDSISLAKKIRDEYGKIDEIVAISRGGIVVGRILSDILEAKISFITIESYEGFEQVKEPVITKGLDPSAALGMTKGPGMTKGKKILLLDELADSGATFIKALSYLKKQSITSLISASLYVKPQTKYIPHFYVKKMDGWILFPYDLRETKALFIEQFGLDGAKKKLKTLGMQDWTKI